MRRDEHRPETVILIKHVRPQVIPTASAPQWRLGDEGRQQCAALADALPRHRDEAPPALRVV